MLSANNGWNGIEIVKQRSYFLIARDSGYEGVLKHQQEKVIDRMMRRAKRLRKYRQNTPNT